MWKSRAPQLNRRILLLITDLEIGGTPTVVRELATRLNDPANGVTVEVACLAKWGPVAEQLLVSGICVTAFGAEGTRDVFGAVHQLRALIRRRQIDTVFSFLIHANTVAAIASAGLNDVRFLQSIQTTQSWPRWHWCLQSWIHDAAEQVIVPSAAVSEMAQQRSQIPSERIRIIPNAIDPADFPRVETFQRSPIRIGFLGRLDRVKNVPALIDAMQLMKDRPVECHIFGYGPMQSEIENQIQRTGQQDRIFLRGKVVQPQAALAEMDILVLPSLGEGFGLVLIEAMASGIPVIAAATPGAAAAAEIITNGENGFLVQGPQLDRQIADCVCRLIDEPELRQRFIENAMQTVREKFTWNRALSKYQHFLRLHDC
jgi:glycosyltransferase involved in cell wall biosynthesis